MAATCPLARPLSACTPPGPTSPARVGDEQKEKQMSKNQVDEFMSPAQIRIEALNIASREAVARAYDQAPTVEIATQLVAFVEGD